MIKAAHKVVQATVIDSIRKRHKLKYRQIAESIGVHTSTIQKVSKGIRLLKKEKFDQLCKAWNVKIPDIINQINLDDKEYLRRKTLLMLMKARKVDMRELSEQIGISILDLFHIQRERREPTSEEIRLISNALDIDSKIIEEGMIAIGMEFLEKILYFLNLEPYAIEAVIQFVEGEI